MPFEHEYGDSTPKFKSRRKLPKIPKSEMTREVAAKYLILDRETGFLYRRKGGRRTALPTKSIYCKVNLLGHIYYAHHLVWLLTRGTWPEHYIDHVNGDPKDNRPSNLRLATHAQNMANRKPYGESQFLGVHFDKSNGKWVAKICSGGKVYQLGRFDDERRAARAYRVAARKLHGKFASYTLNADRSGEAGAE